MTHPYKNAPRQAFWSKSVSRDFRAEELINGDALIRPNETVGSAGSCFASNIVPFLTDAGIEYCRTEHIPSIFGGGSLDNYGYAKFSAAYGHIYTPRHAAQLLKRALGKFTPAENCWIESENLIRDPFRPGLRFPASSIEEFAGLTAAHLQNVRKVFAVSDVFVCKR